MSYRRLQRSECTFWEDLSSSPPELWTSSCFYIWTYIYMFWICEGNKREARCPRGICPGGCLRALMFPEHSWCESCYSIFINQSNNWHHASVCVTVPGRWAVLQQNSFCSFTCGRFSQYVYSTSFHIIYIIYDVIFVLLLSVAAWGLCLSPTSKN